MKKLLPLTLLLLSSNALGSTVNNIATTLEERIVLGKIYGCEMAYELSGDVKKKTVLSAVTMEQFELNWNLLRDKLVTHYSSEVLFSMEYYGEDSEYRPWCEKAYNYFKKLL
ncbi:hypothetical protein NVP1063O_046 [Vibrio phage 1.063.O._10N.261.45.C7]|nr:hypothetical protein NVP1063O_046 [Vibrio phage 1.063.O._10N.261.45.C7]